MSVIQPLELFQLLELAWLLEPIQCEALLSPRTTAAAGCCS